MTQWRVRLGSQAEADIDDILNHTRETFGDTQTNLYRLLLTDALIALMDGPDIPGSRNREDILPGLRSLHITRRGRKGRHLILFRVTDRFHIDVLRILHDAMDVKQHVPDEDDL